MALVENVSHAALVTSSAITSPDNSISIASPTVEGGGFVVSSATTYPSSTSVTVTPSGAPPTYTAALVSNLLSGATNSNATMTVSSGPPYNISADWTAFASISRVVIVGGALGTVPSASTLTTALTTYSTQLATATSTAPWILLFFPGTYSGDNVTIPQNVYLVALEAGSVILSGETIAYTATAASPTSVQSVVGIRFSGGSFTFDSSAKPTNGVNSSLLIQHCSFESSCALSANMRPNGIAGDNNDFYKDNVLLVEVTFDGTSSATYIGGITNMRDCRVSGTTTVGNVSGTGTATIMQIMDSVIAPVPNPGLFINTNVSLFSIRGSILGGNWTVGSNNSVIIIDACQADNTTVVPPLTPWLLNVPSSSTKTYVYNMYLAYVLTRNSTTTWTLGLSNFSSVTQLDRPCRLTLLNPPTGIVTLTVTMTNSYVSQFSLLDGTGTNYTVPPVSTVSLSGTTTSKVLPASSVGSLQLSVNTSAVVGNDDRVCIDIAPPTYNGVTWYV